MSLCIMVAQPGGAHLITDGGIWDAEGVCIDFGRKVALFPGINVAIGFTGFGGHADWIEEAVSHAGLTSTRAILRGLPQLLRDEVALHGSTEPGEALKLHVITYDPEPGPACWIISSDGENMPPGYRPYTVQHLAGWLDFGDPSEILGRPAVLSDPASFDVVADGRALAQAARLTAWDGPAGPTYHVGGFAEVTSVGPSGLQRRRLCEWPKDRVGERTDPFRLAA